MKYLIAYPELRRRARYAWYLFRLKKPLVVGARGRRPQFVSKTVKKAMAKQRPERSRLLFSVYLNLRFSIEIMAFSEFTDPNKTAVNLGLMLRNENLLASFEAVEAPDWLSNMLSFHLSRARRPFSEMFARENLISTVFTFAHMRRARLNMFYNDFQLEGEWPRKPDLNGTPDYLLTYPIEAGALDTASQFPLLAVAEAKNEAFNSGWAQCAAELYVCRQLNEKAGKNGGIPLWGIVTNGKIWEFGKLEGPRLTLHNQTLDVYPLETLLGALDYIFADCLKNGEKIAGEAAAN